MPFLPELSPKYIWDDAHTHPEFKNYLPDEWTRDGKTTDRNFFYGVLATIAPDYVTHLIEDCRLQRSTRKLERQPEQQVVNDIPMEMIEKLLEHPWQSSKYASAAFVTLPLFRCQKSRWYGSTDAREVEGVAEAASQVSTHQTQCQHGWSAQAGC